MITDEVTQEGPTSDKTTVEFVSLILNRNGMEGKGWKEKGEQSL